MPARMPTKVLPSMLVAASLSLVVFTPADETENLNKSFGRRHCRNS